MLHDKRLGGGANQWRGMLLLLLWCLLCCCDVPALAMEQAESSTQILSRAGCACQPTLFSATNSAVTCYQTNSSSPLGCAVDPSDPCADGVLDRTWDLCNVVDLHLVTDRISSTTTTGGSLNATLYGKDRVTLKRAQLSDFILQHKVSKVTLALDNDTAVESVKIEATASMSLRIYEVQTTVNNLPTTIFSPPSPGPISFVSSEETSSTGVVSLLFVPVTEYFNSDVLSQCYFDLVGRCGYHADLQNSFDLFFLAEDNNEPIVAAKSSASPSFRRLSEQEKPRAPTPRPLSFLPKVNDRRAITQSQHASVHEDNELPSGNMVVGAANEPIHIRLTDLLEEIRRTRPEIAHLDLISLETVWHTSSAIKKARIGGLPSKTTGVDGKIVTRWRLVRQSSVVKIYPKDDLSSESNFKLVVQVRVARKVIQYSKRYDVAVDLRLNAKYADVIQPMDQSERLLVDSSEEERRLNTDDTTSQNAVILEMLALIIDLEEDAPLRLVMSELLVIDTTTIAATCHTTFMVFHVENVIRSAKAPSLGVQNVSDIHDPTVAHSCSEILSVWLKPNVTSIQVQIQVELVNVQNVVLGLATIPLIWTVIPSINLPGASRLLVGAHNTLAGDHLELALNYSDVPEGAHVDITVAVGAVNNIDYIEDLDVELLTIREVEVEWVPKSETDQPTSSGEAVYRSLPTRLQGNSTLSFKYQMGSDFSSISTDVVLNSSETRTVWSSESAVIVQDRWNYVEALIDLTYPSTAEIIFRGIASAEDTLRLTEISIRDFIQEMIVGAIDFVRATGGMIYVEISTAKSVPEPVLLRAYVNRLNSSKSPALSFTGSDLQYVGCEAITNMYACGDGSGIHFDSPTQCRSVCSAVETQLKFTPDSIVRSAQMMAFPVVDSFTIEFWAYFESLSTSSSNEQLLLLFGTQEGSLGITLSSSITISRCENQLRIPHGIPLREWTHVAIVFGTNDEVALFIDGSPVADGLLSKNNCDVPSFAYLQLGRDTMDILPDTSVLFGAMDEIRIWKLRHNTVYIFRIRIISKIGAQSAFSIPVSARTRDRASPSKTPQPVVADVTGGSITLVLKEPLDTGGLAIAQYNIFILQNDSFLKWTNAVASSASENTTISVTRDIEGAPLLPETSYTLKVLALQVDVSCDTLAEDGLESDEVTIITEKAAIPAPPPIPVLLQLSGCTALVTATPPDDFGGAGATGMTIGVFMSTGILRESFAVTLDPGVITVRNLLAHTRFLVKASLSTTIGSTEFGEALAFTTEDPSLPGKLAQLSYTNVGPSSVQVQWEEPENTGGGIISGYLIYERVIEANATRKLVYNSSDDSSTTSFLVGDLLAETLYIFSVLPVNQYGILGMDSENVVSITTSAAEAPSSPTNLEQSQVDGGYFDVSFSEPSETVVPQQPPPPELISATGGALYVTVVAPTDCGGSDLSSYVLNIARRTGGSLVYRQYASGPIQSSPYDKQLVNVSIYGLLSKSEYFITVSVENGQGWSQQSDGKAYSTSGPTPVRGMNPPKVALEDPGEITLAWDTPLDSGGLSIVGYMVQARYQLADGSWSPSKIVYDDRSSLVQTALITNIRPNTQYGFSVTAYNFRTQPLRSYLVNGSVEGAELQSLATSREKVD
ncbi:hypothetical protein PF001_g1526 [Phytophthora fragariae]|uniref:Fibronectin type-III domain-containing protein n=1 Tax=Phytophthora fragariae TaxID=53985 RepID=A0A6A4EVV5_9STRA|nr:hypothetical protein PF001_g1526 [Phytophthora fragariae]